MIRFIFGPNSYEIAQLVAERINQYDPQEVERRDGGELTLSQLPDIFQGMSLFASQRLVILKELSANKAVWEALPVWLSKIPDEIEILIIENAPDKRTKTFKALQQHATTTMVNSISEVQAVEWLKDEAVKRGGAITVPAARLLVDYLGTDQWQLVHELEKLVVTGDTSVERIKSTIEPIPTASAFALLDAAFAGREAHMRELLRQCETLEDPYRLFGLLANQIYQLAVVANSGTRSAEETAKAIGAHPYPIKKLQSVARRLSKPRITSAVEAVGALDDQMKRTIADPWILIERALAKIATT